MASQYKVGFKTQHVTIIADLTFDRYTMMCDCGFCFTKKVSPQSGVPRMCKRCYANPSKTAVDDNESRGYTPTEEQMIKEFEDARRATDETTQAV